MYISASQQQRSLHFRGSCQILSQGDRRSGSQLRARRFKALDEHAFYTDSKGPYNGNIPKKPNYVDKNT